MRVAFVGLGVMGYPMAGYLAKAGHDTVVYNRTAEKAEGWTAEYGGTSAPPVAVTDDDGRFEFARQAVGPYEVDVVHARHPAGSFAGRTESRWPN